jgi:hypothetical protein
VRRLRRAFFASHLEVSHDAMSSRCSWRRSDRLARGRRRSTPVIAAEGGRGSPRRRLSRLIAADSACVSRGRASRPGRPSRRNARRVSGRGRFTAGEGQHESRPEHRSPHDARRG